MSRQLIIGMCVVVVAGCASGSDLIARGFDKNPTGAAPLASFPHSDAARNLFLGALQGPKQEQNFEGFAAGSVPTNWNFSGGLGATFVDLATVSSSIGDGVSGVMTYPADGARYLYSETRPGASFFKVSLEVDVNAVGFYFSDASDWSGAADAPGPLVVELLDGNDKVLRQFDLTIDLPTNTIVNGGMGFFGVRTDTAFRSFRVSQPLRASGSNADSDAVGFDRIMVAVPAPGAAALMGFGGVALGRRRRA